MTEDAGRPTDDALSELRAELDRIAEIPLADRVALFERANEVVAGHLADLDEV